MSFHEGVEHFNALRFWEAHEAWETLWLAAAGDQKQFLQGLIQLAAAYHHARRGTLRGAVRLFDSALRRLQPFPAGYWSLDRASAVAAARTHREWAAGLVARGRTEVLPPEATPKLSFSEPNHVPAAPLDGS